MNASTTPSATSVLFARGVIARLATWSTLKIAVQEGWGGPSSAEKRTWLASTILDAFEEQTPVPDDQYIEELLLQVMDDEFDAVLEDGSAESVAQDIVRMWEETRAGKMDTVSRFEKLAARVEGTKAVAQRAGTEGADEWEDEVSGGDEEGDGDENQSDDEVPQLLQPSHPPPRNEPIIDEDGFTLVGGKKKGRR